MIVNNNSNTTKKILIIIASVCAAAILWGPWFVWAAKPFSSQEAHAVPPTLLYTGYDLESIAEDMTPFVGDNSKVSRIAMQLPSPDPQYMQQYIAIASTEQPYGLTLFYEPIEPAGYGQLPNKEEESWFTVKSRENAIVLFAMIGNVDRITFAYRATGSPGELITTDYEQLLTYNRADFSIEADFSDKDLHIERVGQYLAQEHQRLFSLSDADS